MIARSLIACALGLAVTTESMAQVAPPAQSSRRINISKGDVALTPPRVDTVRLVRTDTVFLTRVETVRVPERVVVARVDTVEVPARPVPVLRGPIYGGLYTGMTLPSGNLDRLYANGLHLGAVVGWDGRNQLVGLRLASDISQVNREQGSNAAVVGSTTPVLFAIALDAKLMPIRSEGWQLYGIAGGNFYTHKGLALVTDAGRGLPDGQGGFNRQVTGDGWSTTLGFNAGAGVDFRVGAQDMFLEARGVALQAHGERTWLLPISFGLRYF